MCRGDWKTHGSHTGGFYSCNKYDKSEGKKKDDEAASLKQAAERFQHYWERYSGHEQNKRDAEKAREKILAKTMQYREATGCDPKFIFEANELLIQVRCSFIMYWIISTSSLARSAATCSSGHMCMATSWRKARTP